MQSFIISLIFFAAVLYILMLMLSFFVGTKSVRRQMERDLKTLDRLMGEFKDGLIPFEEDEFKLLSSNPVVKKSKKSNVLFSRGVLSTIYQEPLLAFSLKENRRDNNVLLLAHSDKNKYQLNFKDGETDVYLNEEHIGFISNNHEFIDNSNEVVGRIEQQLGDKYAKVLLHEVDTAHINVFTQNMGESERVFSLFHDFKHEDSEEMVLLTLYYLFIENRAA